jgi:hypothetical protein
VRTAVAMPFEETVIFSVKIRLVRCEIDSTIIILLYPAAGDLGYTCSLRSFRFLNVKLKKMQSGPGQTASTCARNVSTCYVC